MVLTAKAGAAMEFTVEIPANTTAEVILPGAAIGRVTEGGKKPAESEGISGLLQLDEGVKLNLGSGKYCFRYEV